MIKILKHLSCSSPFGIAIFLTATLIFWEPVIHNSSKSKSPKFGAFFAIAEKESTIIAAGEHGQIFYSLNKGKTWEQAKTPVSLSITSIYLLNGHLGWAVGHNGVILKTIDRGASWELIKTPAFLDPPLFCVWFKNEHLGLAAGGDSTIYRTVDGGANWRKEKLALQTHLYSLSETADGQLWISGDHQALFFSNDLGETWKYQQPPFQTSFFGSIALPNQILTVGLRGRVSLWNIAGLIESKIRSDESLFTAANLKDGRIILAGQRGRILISQPQEQPFRSLRISPQKDISGLIEVDDTLIFVGEFGILQVSKSTLGL